MESHSHNPDRHIKPELTVELAEGFRAYIKEGESLVRSGNYAQAIEHFRNSQEMEKIGWKDCSGNARSILLMKTPIQEECRKLAHSIATNSTAGGGVVKLSEIRFMNSVPESDRILPVELQHDIALVYLEEWLHVLQEIQGKSLTGVSFAGQPDAEIDVAAYMQQNEISMTDTFLERYDRGKALESLKQTKESSG